MKRTLGIVFASFAFLLSALPSFSKSPEGKAILKSPTADHQSKSHSYTESREKIEARAVLDAWFADVDRKIQQQQGYDKVVAKMLSQLQQGQPLCCFLSLQKTGKIENLKVTPNNSPELDSLTRSIILESGAFQNPPEQIEYPNNILLKFTKDNNSIVLSTQLYDRKLGGRIGEITQKAN